MISTGAIIFTYLLIMIFLCWSVIYSRGRLGYKCIGVSIALWFSISFFYVLPDLKGWPTDVEMPAKSRVIWLTIVEPNANDPGAFYIWCDTKPDNKQSAINLLNPYKRFNYTGHVEPRAYKLPYDRELHKKILETRKQQQQVGGSWIEIASHKKTKKRGKSGNTIDEVDFKIMNPIEFLPKDGEEIFQEDME